MHPVVRRGHENLLERAQAMDGLRMDPELID